MTLTTIKSAMPHCFLCREWTVIIPGHTKGVTLIDGTIAPVCDSCMEKSQ